MKTILTCLFLLTWFGTAAQTLVLEQPKFPSPEKQRLFFLQEDFFSNIDNFKGDIASVFKIETEYHTDHSMIHLDTVILYPMKRKVLDIKPIKIIDKIGIDSIVKKENNTFELFKIDKEAPYMWQKFTVKNNQIINHLDNGAVEYINKTYRYDTYKHLSRIVVENDYGPLEITFGLSMKGAKFLGKTTLSKQPKGTLVKEISYQYKNDLLESFSSSKTDYKFQLTENTDALLHHLLTTKYYLENSVIKFSKVQFTYNKNKQPIKVIEKIRNVFWSSGKVTNESRIYSLIYQPNKLTIDSNFSSSKQRVYIFDKKQNPKEIYYYRLQEGKKWLYKKIILNIEYK